MLIRLNLRRKQVAVPMRWVERLTRHIMAGIQGMRRFTDWSWRFSLSADRPPTKFAYADRLDQHALRLLKLPEEGGSALDYAIETFVLDQVPDFIALSYTWGPAQRGESVGSSRALTPSPRADAIDHQHDTIHLNSLAFNILPNLHTALQYIVHARPGQYLWVDSICINQGDLEERAAQVGIMDTIYTSALETIIWLGEENEHTNSSLHTIRQVASPPEAWIDSQARVEPPSWAELEEAMRDFLR